MQPLHTPRLELKPATLADVDALWALWRDPLVRRYLWDDREIERDEAHSVVAALVEAGTAGEGGLWLARLRDAPGQLAGCCALRLIAGTREIEIIFALAPAAWGQGLAVELARAVLDHAFEELAVERVWGRTDLPNTASQRVLVRLGMQPAENPGPEATPLVAYVLARG